MGSSLLQSIRHRLNALAYPINALPTLVNDVVVSLSLHQQQSTSYNVQRAYKSSYTTRHDSTSSVVGKENSRERRDMVSPTWKRPGLGRLGRGDPIGRNESRAPSAAGVGGTTKNSDASPPTMTTAGKSAMVELAQRGSHGIDGAPITKAKATTTTFLVNIHRLVLLMTNLQRANANELYVRRVLQEQVGLDPEDVQHLWDTAPHVFRLSVRHDIEPTILYLRSIGIHATALKMIVRANPHILGKEVEHHWLPLYTALHSIVGVDQQDDVCDWSDNYDGSNNENDDDSNNIDGKITSRAKKATSMNMVAGVLIRHPRMATLTADVIRQAHYIVQVAGAQDHHCRFLVWEYPELFERICRQLHQVMMGDDADNTGRKMPDDASLEQLMSALNILYEQHQSRRGGGRGRRNQGGGGNHSDHHFPPSVPASTTLPAELGAYDCLTHAIDAIKLKL